jgi:hypothetical protein
MPNRRQKKEIGDFYHKFVSGTLNRHFLVAAVMGWLFKENYSSFSCLLFPLKIHTTPTITDCNFLHQGIVNRK